MGVISHVKCLEKPSLKMKLISFRKKGSSLQSFKIKGVNSSLNKTTPYKFSETHSFWLAEELFFGLHLVSALMNNPSWYITSFLADILANCTRLSQDFSFGSHNVRQFIKRRSASWNNKKKNKKKGIKIFFTNIPPFTCQNFDHSWSRLSFVGGNREQWYAVTRKREKATHIFACILLASNHMIFFVKFGINQHS